MNLRTTFSIRWPSAAASCATLALAACGGGGNSNIPAAAPTSLVITGTAATGAAIAAAAVEAKCATGVGSATTSADGTFTITISGGVLPCVLRVTAGVTVLHSLAVGSGSTARANVTPVTELVVARHSSALPSVYYAGFDGAAAAALTAAAAQSATAAIVETLRASVDFSSIGDPIAGALVAARAGVAGDAYDQRLDALQSRLTTAGVTMAELTQGVARGAPGAAVGTRTGVASLPPELLLAPAAASCASLRSGRYRVVINGDGGAAPATEVITINAVTLTVVDASGDVTQLTPTGTCIYTSSAGGEMVVNKAGVIVARVAGFTTDLYGAVLFPEQPHTLAELAGDYNAIAFDRTVTNGPIHLTSSSSTLDAAGKLTALNFCDDLRTCVASTAATLPNITLTANAAGGFNFSNVTDGYVDRAFAYRSGGGELMVVVLSTAGHISFATRVAPASLPAVGRIQQFWNMFVNAQYVSPTAINLSRNTVTSVDAATGIFTREAVQNFATGATRPETLQINSLRSGYNRRAPANGVIHSDGSASNVSEFISLTMRGMDLSVFALPASNQLGLASLQSSTP